MTLMGLPGDRLKLNPNGKMQPRLVLLHSHGLSLEDVQAERVWIVD